MYVDSTSTCSDRTHAEYVGAVEASDRDALTASLNAELVRLIHADGDVAVSINESAGEHGKTQGTYVSMHG